MYVVVAVLFNAGDHEPVIPLVEVVGNALNVAPEQTGDTAAKVGVTIAFTVMESVAVDAHCPAVGVNVYVVVAVLFNAGDHVPVIPFKDVVGNADKVAPEQIGATAVNVGVVNGFTVIVNEAVAAHCPGFGVNVYVVVAVLFNAGDQEPVIPFEDVVGSALNGVPVQIGDTAEKVGVTLGVTEIDNVVEVAHTPAFGANVYVVVAMLFNAGDHVPAKPFNEVVGNALNDSPEQIDATDAKVGVPFGVTVIVNVAVFAHCPAVGVNVYVVVAVLFNAGDHVPVIPFV